MPRYEYRDLRPIPAAAKPFLEWIEQLDREFTNRDPEHRSTVVRDALHQLYLGRPYVAPNVSDPVAEQVLVHSFDPRTASLDRDYAGAAAAVNLADRKPLIWFWMMS